MILNCVGAVLIATGQEIVAHVTDMWLRAHEAFLVSLGGRDVQRISGIDDQNGQSGYQKPMAVTHWLVAVRCRHRATDHSAFSA